MNSNIIVENTWIEEEFHKFDELIYSKDRNNVILGITMLRFSSFINSIFDESDLRWILWQVEMLNGFRLNIGWSIDFSLARGELISKINSQIAKLRKIREIRKRNLKRINDK